MEITIRIPKLTTILRHWKWGLLAALVVALTLGLGQAAIPTTKADVPGGRTMSLVVKNGDPDCDSNTYVGENCRIEKDSKFTLSVDVKSYPVPYIGFQTMVVYGGQLTYQPTGTAGEEIKWPESFLPARIIGAGVVTHNDVSGLIPPFPTSTFKGNIVNLEFYCDPQLPPEKGWIELIPYDEGSGEGSGFLLEDGTVVPANPAVLGIDCVAPQEINITTQNVQQDLPGACYDVYSYTYDSSFNVCDNNIGTVDEHDACLKDGTPECLDDDSTTGFIRVAVDPGNYDVTQKLPPPGHVIDQSIYPCNPESGVKCDVTIKNMSINMPWWPWDLDGDGLVRIGDVLEVIDHYRDDKPY